MVDDRLDQVWEHVSLNVTATGMKCPMMKSFSRIWNDLIKLVAKGWTDPDVALRTIESRAIGEHERMMLYGVELPNDRLFVTEMQEFIEDTFKDEIMIQNIKDRAKLRSKYCHSKHQTEICCNICHFMRLFNQG